MCDDIPMLHAYCSKAKEEIHGNSSYP
jgi:hypothetical protein